MIISLKHTLLITALIMQSLVLIFSYLTIYTEVHSRKHELNCKKKKVPTVSHSVSKCNLHHQLSLIVNFVKN